MSQSVMESVARSKLGAGPWQPGLLAVVVGGFVLHGVLLCALARACACVPLGTGTWLASMHHDRTRLHAPSVLLCWLVAIRA